jgi:hypothetical protein
MAAAVDVVEKAAQHPSFLGRDTDESGIAQIGTRGILCRFFDIVHPKAPRFQDRPIDASPNDNNGGTSSGQRSRPTNWQAESTRTERKPMSQNNAANSSRTHRACDDARLHLHGSVLIQKEAAVTTKHLYGESTGLPRNMASSMQQSQPESRGKS